MYSGFNEMPINFCSGRVRILHTDPTATTPPFASNRDINLLTSQHRRNPTSRIFFQQPPAKALQISAQFPHLSQNPRQSPIEIQFLLNFPPLQSLLVLGHNQLVFFFLIQSCSLEIKWWSCSRSQRSRSLSSDCQELTRRSWGGLWRRGFQMLPMPISMP